MIRRIVLVLGLSVAAVGSIAGAVHASSHPTPHVVSQTSRDTTDGDKNAPCAINSTSGEQTGNCSDRNDTAGVQDNSDTPDENNTESTAGDPAE